ncbi:tyrosine-type recombinase/integrase [Actinoplanes solisilvae]|uniref:tyrosine-type recombinase/integrase n=1 Tax=Actinoplanes solisilvae TaxID=2486853 RepID=UPI0013E2DE1B|nr:tyrosine-type recombinase/integrase [Actinoplanes solisilvae]
MRLRKLSPETIDAYERTYRLLTRWAEHPAAECKRAEIEEWIIERQEKVAATTVAQNIQNLKIFFKWAVAEEWISNDPMKKIESRKVEVPPRRVLDAKEMRALIDACKGTRYIDIRDRAIIRILCEVGTPRLGELLNMRMESVDFGHDLLELNGKTGKRFIPIGDKCAHVLDRYMWMRAKHRLSNLDSFWLSTRGPISKQAVRDLISRRALAAGIQGSVFPHLFRHATASRASAAGISDSLMEPLYGWSDGSRMPRVYGAATRVARAQSKARDLGLGDRL